MRTTEGVYRVWLVCVYVCACACACVWVCACVRGCVGAWVRACVGVCVSGSSEYTLLACATPLLVWQQDFLES